MEGKAFTSILSLIFLIDKLKKKCISVCLLSLAPISFCPCTVHIEITK